jgi:hypothetical protein
MNGTSAPANLMSSTVTTIITETRNVRMLGALRPMI